MAQVEDDPGIHHIRVQARDETHLKAGRGWLRGEWGREDGGCDRTAGGPRGRDPGKWSGDLSQTRRPGQPRAPHYKAGVAHATSPRGNDLPRVYAVPVHSLANCHLQEEQRDPHEQQHDSVDEEEAACEESRRDPEPWLPVPGPLHGSRRHAHQRGLPRSPQH